MSFFFTVSSCTWHCRILLKTQPKWIEWPLKQQILNRWNSELHFGGQFVERGYIMNGLISFIQPSLNAKLVDCMERFKTALLTSNTEQIMILGTQILHKNYKSLHHLGTEGWNVVEEVFIQATLYSFKDWAQFLLRLLKKEFPKSSRVKRYEALYESCDNRQDKALSIYKELLEDNPGDIETRKYLIALYVSCGNIEEAITLLVQHLVEFASDDDAWIFLAQLYLTQSCVPQSIFCYEEVFLHNAHHVSATLKLAELLASIKQFNDALRYYFIVLHQHPNHLRGLWGIVWTTYTALHDTQTLKTLDQKTNEKMQESLLVCSRQLRSLYEKADGHTLDSSLLPFHALCCSLLDDLSRE